MSNATKYNLQTVEAIISELAKSGCVATACQVSNITQVSFYKWIKKYPDFATQVETAKEEFRRSRPEEIKEQARRCIADYLFRGNIIEWETTGETIKRIEDAKGNLKSIERETFTKKHREKRPTPQWAIDRILGKNIEILDAIQILLSEGVATQEQAQAVAEGIAEMERKLKILQ